jgi:hypothetical protein
MFITLMVDIANTGHIPQYYCHAVTEILQKWDGARWRFKDLHKRLPGYRQAFFDSVKIFIIQSVHKMHAWEYQINSLFLRYCLHVGMIRDEHIKTWIQVHLEWHDTNFHDIHIHTDFFSACVTGLISWYNLIELFELTKTNDKNLPFQWHTQTLWTSDPGIWETSVKRSGNSQNQALEA